jgi:2-haloacid dehalogenase
VSSKRGIDLSDTVAGDVVAVMRSLKPYPDVVDGLRALQADGYRMITLTNGSTDAVADQIVNAGLSEFFEATLSVDRVERFKPSPETYLSASIATGVELDHMLMGAAHDWDILGARTVGMPGAYIHRPGAAWSLSDKRPDIDVPDIAALADVLTS